MSSSEVKVGAFALGGAVVLAGVLLVQRLRGGSAAH